MVEFSKADRPSRKLRKISKSRKPDDIEIELFFTIFGNSPQLIRLRQPIWSIPILVTLPVVAVCAVTASRSLDRHPESPLAYQGDFY